MATAAPRYVVNKVIDANELEMYTNSGWKLEEVLNESHVEKHQESIPLLTSNGYVQRESVDKSLVVIRKRYLMSRPSDSPLAMREQELQATRHSLESVQYKLEDAKREADKKQKEIESLKSTVASEEKYTESYRKQFNDSEVIRRKMETDIAKIRHAVGDLKMKEILGQ